MLKETMERLVADAEDAIYSGVGHEDVIRAIAVKYNLLDVKYTAPTWLHRLVEDIQWDVEHEKSQADEGPHGRNP